MKKIIISKTSLLLVLLTIFSLSSCLTISSIYYNNQEKKCYSDKTNFINVTATLSDIRLYDEEYILTVENMEYIPLEEKENSYYSGFQDNSFRINKENSKLLKSSNIEEKLKKGTVFSFMSSPSVFGNGYNCPIVSVTVDGEILLDFDTGYKNLMAEYNVVIE